MAQALIHSFIIHVFIIGYAPTLGQAPEHVWVGEPEST